MPTYKYTSPYPGILMDLSHGTKGLSIVRASGERDEPAAGATVTLEQGDLLTVRDEYEHAYLEDQAGVTPRKSRTPETPAAPAETLDAPASDTKGK